MTAAVYPKAVLWPAWGGWWRWTVRLSGAVSRSGTASSRREAEDAVAEVIRGGTSGAAAEVHAA